MIELIRHVLVRLGEVFVPHAGTGKRRAGTPLSAHRHGQCSPAHRGRVRTREPEPFINGDASPLVRPYLVAYEQEERRTALALALDGIDVGPWFIHGVKVGGGV